METLGQLLGSSPGIQAVRDKIERLLARQQDARRLPPVLIQGETGTGKGLVARLLHRAGPRREGPFVDVNCAAIPETLLEAEMFGFERGAFTDARRAKPGLFQTAHRGTIFLDEVGLLPEALQAKLLKVLEDRTVRRLGATRDEPVDVWIVAATNADLRAGIRERRFREDLYHRLAVLTLVLPPLRERGGDIAALAEHFLARACADYGVAPKRLAREALARLEAYAWPGNVRELANVMERVALLGEASEVTADLLGLGEVAPVKVPPPAPAASPGSLDDAVRDHVLEVLTQTRWNISRSAALLGISRNTLRARIDRYGLAPAGGRATAPRRPPRPTARAAAREPAVPPVPTPLRWERRPVALLRATLATPGEDEVPLDASRALETVLDKARTFGGRIEGMSPGAVLIAFGLDAVEDAPRRAAHAALAIQRALDRARREDPRQPPGRLAIHVGQLLVGRGAGAAQLEEDARRAALGRLDALVEQAERGTIVVSEAAAPFFEREFELLELPARGRGTAERTFALVGRLGSAFDARRRPATFVGRQRELELLWSRFESAVRGQGQLVGIAGEAGIGKSRLLHEFRQSLAGKSVRYLEGRCHSYGVAIPYLPVLDVLRGLAEVTDTDTPETLADKVGIVLASAGLEPGESGPCLLHLLGLKEEGGQLEGLEPEAIKARVFQTLRTLTLNLSRGNHPLVLVVEDLHWIDGVSEEFFAALADSAAGARLLMVSTHRPGYRPPWIDRSYATQVALQPLAPADSLRVARAALAGREVPDALVDLIVARAEGNPFFIEELAHAVREQGAAARVPDTIQGVLLGRIDRLAPDDRRLLQIAAVVGKDAPLALVRAVADLDPSALAEGLARLTRAEFLYETGAGPEPEYTFRHALTHEVTYASLAADDRRAFHARLVDAIEALPPERRAAEIDHLAHHAFAGGLWEKAVGYLRQAGARAAARSAHREAAARFEQALAALARLPLTRERQAEAIDVRFDLRTSLLPLGELDRILEHMREAEALAEALGDERRLGQLCTYVTNYHFMTGDQERALDYGKRALAIADRVGDFALGAETNLRLGQVYHALAEYRRAADILERTVTSLTGDRVFARFGLPLVFSVGCRNWLVRSLVELGEFDAALRRGEEAMRIAEEAQHPFSLVVADWGIGHLCLRRGDLGRAVATLERGVGRCRTWSIVLWLPRMVATLGSALSLSGRAVEALPLLEEAVALNVSMRSLGDHAFRLVQLSEGYLLAGRPADAVALAEQALALARTQRERGHEAWAHRTLGEIAAHRDGPDVGGAEAAYRTALGLAERLGMRPLAAHCRLGLGRLYAASGRRAEAAAHLGAADEAYRAMAMPFWRALAEGELARSG